MAVFLLLSGQSGDHLQRIYVEETLSVMLHAAEHTVVKRPFHHIGETAVRFQFQHPAGKEDQSDGSAGFRVDGIVWQVVVGGESFPVYRGADSSGDIHLTVYGVVEQTQTCLPEGIVVDLACKIRHRRIQIHGSYTVASRMVLFSDRCIVLGIVSVGAVRGPVMPAAVLFFFLEIVRFCSPFVDEILRKVQITVLAGSAVKAQERKLDLFMAGDSPGLSFSEAMVNMVSHPAHDIQQVSLARCLIICDGSFYHMSGAVQFVAVMKILPAVLRLLDGEIGVQITVFLLGSADQCNDVVSTFFQCRVGAERQGVCHGFQPFCHVTVLKDHAVIFAVGLSGSDPEIFNGMALLHIRKLIFQDLFLIGDHGVFDKVLEIRPEAVLDPKAGKRDFMFLFFYHNVCFSFQWVRFAG